MSPYLTELLAQCEATKASDIHIATGQIPRFRIQGSLIQNPAFDKMNSEKVDAVAMELGIETLPVGCPDGSERIRTTLLREGSIDGAISSQSGTRYRFNIFRYSGSTAIALRRLDNRFHTLKELGLPPQLANFCRCADGLFVVSGATGSGKSTTLATLIDLINRTRYGHIITIEDPIEFVHESRMCLVNQRQVGRDAKSFNDALVESLRQDPDVILVGEIRDLATVRTALTAAETGHLVFTTLHAGDTVGTIERLVSVFPPDEQSGVRKQLALILRGVFTQHLLTSPIGGRAAAYELLVNTSGIANLISTGRSSQIYSAIEAGGNKGMVSLEDSLAGLVREGRIEEESAKLLSHSPETLMRRINSRYDE